MPSTALSYWPGPSSVSTANAAREPAVDVHGDPHLLEAVHARERDHHRDAPTPVAGRQMEPGRQRLGPGTASMPLHAVVRESGVPRVALALALVLEAGSSSLFSSYRPLRRRPVDGRHEVVLARGHQYLPSPSAAAPWPRDGARSSRTRATCRPTSHARADRGKVGVRFRAARGRQVDRARLIPVHPDRADGVVEQPALLGEASGHRAAMRDRPQACCHRRSPRDAIPAPHRRRATPVKVARARVATRGAMRPAVTADDPTRRRRCEPVTWWFRVREEAADYLRDRSAQPDIRSAIRRLGTARPFFHRIRRGRVGQLSGRRVARLHRFPGG